MLKIRLQRIGRRNDPVFRLIVAEHTTGPKSGKFIEKLGSYNPKSKERTLNAERINHWISVGAGTSDTVHNMLVSEGVVKGKKVNVLPKKTVPAKEEVETEKPAEQSAAPEQEGEEAATETETPAEGAEEAPQEEEKPASA